jgi:hypothetical protein
MLTAASIATRNSSSVAFSGFGSSSGERNTHLQTQLSDLYKANFASFSNWKFILGIALECALGDNGFRFAMNRGVRQSSLNLTALSIIWQPVYV